MHEPAHVPHEQARVELVVAQATADPARAPMPQRHDDRAQFLTRFGQAVLPDFANRRAMHHADLFQMAQPLRQQVGGHPGYAAVQFIEAFAAAQQFAHDQGCPALAQCFGTARDRAELTVAFVHRLPSRCCNASDSELAPRLRHAHAQVS
ncbi:hypothetical protein D3C80_1586820 [compost metagenome]